MIQIELFMIHKWSMCCIFFYLLLMCASNW